MKTRRTRAAAKAEAEEAADDIAAIAAGLFDAPDEAGADDSAQPAADGDGAAQPDAGEGAAAEETPAAAPVRYTTCAAPTHVISGRMQLNKLHTTCIPTFTGTRLAVAESGRCCNVGNSF